MDGWTPLHVATYYDNYGVMSILLEAGANVFALDCDLNYPINHIMNGLYTFLATVPNLKELQSQSTICIFFLLTGILRHQ